ncbi:hypothetical protein PG984_005663 [Apiospora sp. TS-2023a]
MSKSNLRYLLDVMSPGVAQRRLATLETNTEFLNAMPFNGDYAEKLKDVLGFIAREDTPNRQHSMAILETHIQRSPKIMEAMSNFLRDTTPISDDELLQTVCFLLSEEKFEAFDELWLTSREGMTIYDELEELYSTKDVAADDIRHCAHQLIGDLKSIDREVFYFHLKSNNLTPPLASDIDRLARRCNHYIAGEVLQELPESWGVTGTPLGQFTALLKRAPGHHIVVSEPDKRYAAKLGWAVRNLSAYDAETLISSFNRASARLAMMPRCIARNYYTASEQLDRDGYGDEKATLIATAIYNNCKCGPCSRDTLSRVIEDVKHACSNAPRYRQIPRSLADAPVRFLIDIHNVLVDFLSERGYSYEGSSFAKGTP